MSSSVQVRYVYVEDNTRTLRGGVQHQDSPWRRTTPGLSVEEDNTRTLRGGGQHQDLPWRRTTPGLSVEEDNTRTLRGGGQHQDSPWRRTIPGLSVEEDKTRTFRGGGQRNDSPRRRTTPGLSAEEDNTMTLRGGGQQKDSSWRRTTLGGWGCGTLPRIYRWLKCSVHGPPSCVALNKALFSKLIAKSACERYPTPYIEGVSTVTCNNIIAGYSRQKHLRHIAEIDAGKPIVTMFRQCNEK
ncbi:hypothetical protein LSAT2_006100, partial [Lamellibrachia satsuma]